MSFEELGVQYKKHRFINLICIILFVGVALLGCLIYKGSKAEFNTKKKIRPVVIVGMYKINNDVEWKLFNDYNDIPINNYKLMIKDHIKENIPYGKTVFAYSQKIVVDIFVNGVHV